MRLILFLISAVAAATIALLSVSPSESKAVDRDGRIHFGSFHDCGDLNEGTNASNIEALRVGCDKARRVIRSFLRQARGDDDFNREVGGFHCYTIGHFGVGGGYRCAAAGKRVIRFITGG
jgi:hypothetical protein